MTGPTMTPDDMSPTPMNGDQPLEPQTVEAILGAAQPSGDAALDAVLEELRRVGEGPAPEPTGELAALLASGATTPLTSARARKARHVATGTTAVAGILLVTATAAAAIGTMRDELPPGRPTLPPAVVVHPRPAPPRPAGTGAANLPAVHAATVGSPDSRTHSPRHQPVPVLGSTPRHAGEADEDSREALDSRGDGEGSARARTSEAPDADEAPVRDSTGTSSHDDGDDPSAPGTGGEHDADDDSSWTPTSDDGGSEGGQDGGSHDGSEEGSDDGHTGDSVAR